MAEKTGERALEAMKQLNSEVSVFKLPRVPRVVHKKNQMKILSEEKYVEELGKIIQKDFFPDLEKLKAQNQYLDAVEKNDLIKLRELYAKYSGNRPSERLGSESPATFETPQRNTPSIHSFPTPSSHLSDNESSAASTTSSKKMPSDGHSLDSFMATYTSEDNCSFQEIIESADKKLRQKFSVLFDAEKETALAIAKSLDVPCIEDQFRPICGPKTIDMWKYTNKNSIMYVPDGVELTKEEQMEMAKQKQTIDYSNTRYHANPHNETQSNEKIVEMSRNLAKNQSGKIGVDGNSQSLLGATPNIRGFSFVKTPSPHPGFEAQSPLMTWGELEGTPFRLDGSDTPIPLMSGPSFRIHETSKRENIGLALAEKAGERMRDQKAKALETARRNITSPHIRSTLDRLATMSPAAKRLASSSIAGRDSLLTPSPRSTPRKSHTPSPLVRRKTTPRISSQSKTVLTDDLLNIPNIINRPK